MCYYTNCAVSCLLVCVSAVLQRRSRFSASAAAPLSLALSHSTRLRCASESPLSCSPVAAPVFPSCRRPVRAAPDGQRREAKQSASRSVPSEPHTRSDRITRNPMGCLSTSTHMHRRRSRSSQRRRAVDDVEHRLPAAVHPVAILLLFCCCARTVGSKALPPNPHEVDLSHFELLKVTRTAHTTAAGDGQQRRQRETERTSTAHITDRRMKQNRGEETGLAAETTSKQTSDGAHEEERQAERFAISSDARDGWNVRR